MMKKEKSETSTSSSLNFPKGDWDLSIREGVEIGYLRFTETSGSTAQYLGSMQFENDSRFGNISNSSFAVEISYYSPETGVIVFQILDAATIYNQNTSPPFQFIFQGYCETDKLWGTAKIPKDFGGTGKPGEDGDTVSWTAGVHGDTRHKRSK
jgi:hypothetical protein